MTIFTATKYLIEEKIKTIKIQYKIVSGKMNGQVKQPFAF